MSPAVVADDAPGSAAYFGDIWRARYFWMHLARSDLRSKWRRSFFGVLWTVIQPLGLTLLVAFVLGRIFHADVVRYAPYVLSGILVWDYLTATAVGGSLAFIQADAYIKQFKHPLAIYTLRTTVFNLIALSLASVSLFGWCLIVFPQNFGWCWLATLTLIPLAGLIGWPMATTLAYVSVRFRDLPFALGLILQTLWFFSPIYFDARLFRDNGLSALVDYNPIYHLLQLLRAPLLVGEWPAPVNFFAAAALGAALALIAWRIGRRAENNVIFYL